MKLFIAAVLMATVVTGACKTDDKKLAKSYSYVKTFLGDAGIMDEAIIYFYKGRPKSNFPNVYCFDSNGAEVMSLPQCYQVIEDYIKLLNDSIIPPKKNGWQLHSFLDSAKVIDIYNREVDRSSLKGYDYYLFIDYVAIPLPGLGEALRTAQKATMTSKKKIRLFLVHAISEYNIQYFRKKSEGTAK
jgi:hypothetical protein